MTFSPSWRSCIFSLCLLMAGSIRADSPPRLVVVISIDQCRADYLERFRPFFGPDGFNRLLGGGAVFTDCHQRHSVTKTAPGHAVMLSGVHANQHGVIANDWLDRDSFERVSCVGDKRVEIVGLPPSSAPRLPGIDDPYLGRSPRNLLVATVGDELKKAGAGRPKVIGISNKDRAAILMSGRQADAAYFMENGRMVTSTYYMPALPAWVAAWNAAGKADAFFGKVWDRVLPVADYAVQGPDDAPGEDGTTDQLGATLPKVINGGETKPGPKFYDAFETSPFSNEVLEDFVETAVTSENLGGRAGVTDLLCVSFSANDHIGHFYGPDSHEIMDNMVRMDRTLAGFFKFLDRGVGLKNCTIVLTADHGVAPMPETVRARMPGTSAGRVDTALLERTVEAALNRVFGPLQDGSAWTVRDDNWFLLYPAAMKEKQVAPAAAQAVVRDALLTLDFIAAAYTREQLEKGGLTDESGRAALLSFNRARSGDIFFQTKPYFFNKATGSTHGTPYDYDTHVPLIWYGAGVKPGVHSERVGVDDLAPTLAHLLGVPAPPLAAGRILF
ncbi:alkaline phosphatase family protein [Opitutus sp. GAS368]|uniref:alkaline phosphatase family protein n=1 Tax=Opitutus sp. GAS368 TaxID=1882749 RepID=UPI00087A55F2|nr:alkaline phosphatase family protein [Opitutus sp. GAS368]SDS30889.1 Type I phosphodiesterase / nucleotide pyrophosphatase [Opitutus sp. GAS368]